MADAWKLKRMVQELESAKGNGTSMITIMVPQGGQLAKTQRLLTEEYGTATNIKSRVNRQSVLSAITSAQERLKLLNNRTPPNGLALYCGLVVNEDGKERKVTMAIEPFKPLSHGMYMCDNRFHVEALKELLDAGVQKFGFIVMDGNGAFFATVSGNHREVLHKFDVELPKKHGRGGQSALRFGRLRMEKRHNYVRKVAEVAVNCFIDQGTNQCNVAGLILAGSADFKTELNESSMFDPRLQTKVMKVVDVAYGGDKGFHEAIELSADVLANVKFVQEKRLISKLFDEIGENTSKCAYGVDDTLRALEAGAVETLIVWEELDMTRYVLKNTVTGENVVKIVPKDGEQNFKDPKTGAVLEVLHEQTLPLLEWLAEEYTRFGCELEFVTDKSEVGNQFCKGFGGIGAILRYPLDLSGYDDLDDDDEDVVDSDDEAF